MLLFKSKIPLLRNSFIVKKNSILNSILEELIKKKGKPDESICSEDLAIHDDSIVTQLSRK